LSQQAVAARSLNNVSLLASMLCRSAVTAAVALVIAVPAVPPAAARPGPEGGFADLAEKLLPSVVNISTTQTLKPEHKSEQKSP
jgi:S1-C subfamily serine protease